MTSAVRRIHLFQGEGKRETQAECLMSGESDVSLEKGTGLSHLSVL